MRLKLQVVDTVMRDKSKNKSLEAAENVHYLVINVGDRQHWFNINSISAIVCKQGVVNFRCDGNDYSFDWAAVTWHSLDEIGEHMR